MFFAEDADQTSYTNHIQAGLLKQQQKKEKKIIIQVYYRKYSPRHIYVYYILTYYIMRMHIYAYYEYEGKNKYLWNFEREIRYG